MAWKSDKTFIKEMAPQIQITLELVFLFALVNCFARLDKYLKGKSIIGSEQALSHV